jgi:hypothetical protein
LSVILRDIAASETASRLPVVSPHLEAVMQTTPIPDPLADPENDPGSDPLVPPIPGRTPNSPRDPEAPDGPPDKDPVGARTISALVRRYEQRRRDHHAAPGKCMNARIH